ncbi:MAG: oligosaccharide flippase family protein [Nitrococcus sp.]|nr:oligosaccharide flippase family protein [Nitrococcus sp.]
MDKRVLGGIGWIFLVKLAVRGLGLVSVLILARLLTPEDFGLVAMATSIVALVALMRAFSFDDVRYACCAGVTGTRVSCSRSR